MILGDSVDRNIVEMFQFLPECRKVTVIEDWAHGVINYGTDTKKDNPWGLLMAKVPTAYVNCSNGDSLAFAHIFGAKPFGPYHLGWKNSPQDLYVDTIARVEKVLEIYYYKFPR